MNQWIFIVLTWTSTVDTGIYCSYLTTSVCKSLFNLNYFNAWYALTFSIIEKSIGTVMCYYAFIQK